MLRRAKHSKIEVVAPKEEEEEVQNTTALAGHKVTVKFLSVYLFTYINSNRLKKVGYRTSLRELNVHKN